MADKIIVKENDVILEVKEISLTRNLNNDYNELTNKPDLNAFLSPDNIIQGNNIILEKNGNNITINSSGGVTDYNELTNKPNLATVATTGNYTDLTNKPNLVAGSNVYLTTSGNDIIINASGGSGGGSSVLRGNSFKNATPNADWSGYSVITKLDASKIINSCNSFKVKLLINSTTTSCKIEKFVIKRTNVGSTTVLDTTNIPISGQVASSSNIVTLSLTANVDNFITSDACNLSIDLDHDYYIIVYFQSDPVNVNLNLRQVSTDGDLNTEYTSGDLTTATTISQNTFGYALLFKQIIIAS